MRSTPVVGALSLVLGMAKAVPGTAEPFHDGDRVCIVGDSITKGGMYQFYIKLFYNTRLPERKVHIYNLGVSGDNAPRVANRLGWDVFPFRPTCVTLMLGGNDVGGTHYGAGKYTPGRLSAEQLASVDAYRVNMDTLVGALVEKLGRRVILLTPRIYEENPAVAVPGDGEIYYGQTEGLGKLAEVVTELAGKYGIGLVDVYAAMRGISAREQARDATFSIIVNEGGNRSHPGRVGHAVMAYTFLKAQGVPRYVSKVVLDAAAMTVVEQTDCRVSELAADRGAVRFRLLARSLPMPLARADEKGMNLVPFHEEMNQEIVSVTGLAAGAYSLSIDGASVGRYTGAELAAGINLATNPATPQYAQAMKVRALTERNPAENRIREWARINTGMALKGVDFRDEAKADAYIQELIAASPEPGADKPFREYLETRSQMDALREQCDAHVDGIYRINQPVQRVYVLERER